MTTIFSAKDVSKTYSSFTLHPFDLSLLSGKVYGVVGENAAGKTTLLRIIAHDLKEKSGEMAYFSSNNTVAEWDIARQHIAYITQELAPWKGTMYEYVLFAAITHGLKPEAAIRSTEAIMDRLGISELGTRGWTEISGGYKLRFAMAAAFVWHPKLVVMDEPLANLDINTQHLVLEAIKEFVQDEAQPKTVIISSQHLVEIEKVADDLIYLDQGKLMFSGNKTAFGADRETNVFELHCDCDETTLRQALASFDGIKISSSGFDVILETPLDVESKNILNTLIKNDIDINYFRNISQSSRKFFIHE